MTDLPSKIKGLKIQEDMFLQINSALWKNCLQTAKISSFSDQCDQYNISHFIKCLIIWSFPIHYHKTEKISYPYKYFKARVSDLIQFGAILQ